MQKMKMQQLLKRLPNEDAVKRLAEGRLSYVVREAEKLVAQELNRQKNPPKPAKVKSQDLVNLETELSDLLTTKVSFKMGAKGKGKLIIDFANLDILDGLLAKIRKVS